MSYLPNTKPRGILTFQNFSGSFQYLLVSDKYTSDFAFLIKEVHLLQSWRKITQSASIFVFCALAQVSNFSGKPGIIWPLYPKYTEGTMLID